MANQAIKQIEQNPAVKTVYYHSVGTDLIGFIRNRIAIKGLVITLNDLPDDPILIQRIRLHGYQESTHHVPLSFTLYIDNLHVASLKHTAISGAKVLSRYIQKHAGSPVIVSLKKPAEVTVYQGQTALFHQELLAGKHDLPTSNFPTGTYHLTIVTKNIMGKKSTHKQLFVKSTQTMPWLPLLEKISKGSLLHFNGKIAYHSKKTMLNVDVSALWQNQKILHYTISLHPYKLTQRPYNITAILDPLMKAYMEKSSLQVHIKGKMDQSLFPKKSAPYAMLSELGYKTLPFLIQAQGQASLKTKHSDGRASIDLTNAAKLSWRIKTLLGKPRPIAMHFKALENLSTTNTKELPHIALIQVTYQDHSLIQRILKVAAKKMHQKPAQLQKMANTFLQSMLTQTHVPTLESAIKALQEFVNNPQSLTVALTPAKPFDADLFNQFLKSQSKENQQFNRQLKAYPKAERAALRKHHQQQNNQTTEAFLKKIGFSVTAN